MLLSPGYRDVCTGSMGHYTVDDGRQPLQSDVECVHTYLRNQLRDQITTTRPSWYMEPVVSTFIPSFLHRRLNLAKYLCRVSRSHMKGRDILEIHQYSTSQHDQD